MKIHGTPNLIHKIDDKRFYIPGIIIEDNCPVCGTKSEWNGNTEYIRYPSFKGTESIPFYCEQCDEFFNKEIKITFQILIEEVKED